VFFFFFHHQSAFYQSQNRKKNKRRTKTTEANVKCTKITSFFCFFLFVFFFLAAHIQKRRDRLPQHEGMPISIQVCQEWHQRTPISIARRCCKKETPKKAGSNARQKKKIIVFWFCVFVWLCRSSTTTTTMMTHTRRDKNETPSPCSFSSPNLWPPTRPVVSCYGSCSCVGCWWVLVWVVLHS